MPAISTIPDASPLQTQLSSLNSAIRALGNPGTTIPIIVVLPGAPAPGEPMPLPAIRLTLDPPIARPTTLQQLQTALQAQADAITEQLVRMGFSDDTGQMALQGPAPRPAA